MKICILKKVIVVLLIILSSAVSSGQTHDSVKVTYLANSGFMVESATKKILIDAVFDDCIGDYDCPDAALIERIFEKTAPFERIDFVLVTHNHPDHVSDSLLFELLRARNDFELVIPQQVYSLIENRNGFPMFEDRIHEIDLDSAEITNILIHGTEFNIARSKHADTYELQNLCYIINDNGFRILHSGDCWPESIEDIEESYFNDIDLAIVPLAFGKDRFFIFDSVIKPGSTILSHVKTNFSAQLKEIMAKDSITFLNKEVIWDTYEERTFGR